MKNKIKKTKRIIELSIASVFILGIVACAICDLAISKKFSWSLYPIISIVFAALVILPLFHFKKGVRLSLISFSIFIVPFLFCLEAITGVDWLLSIGIPNAAILIAYLWIIYGVFSIKKLRWWYSSAISLIISIPFGFLVNFALSKVINEQIIDVWDILTYGIIAVISIGLFCVGRFSQRKTVSQ